MKSKINHMKTIISYILVVAIVISVMPTNINISYIRAAEGDSSEISIDLSTGLAGAVYTGTTQACIYSAEQGYGYTNSAADWTDWAGAKDTSSTETDGVFYISKGGTYRITTNGTNILGNIVIKSDEEVTLILDNVNITGSKSIYRTSPYEASGYYPVNMGLAPIDIQGKTVCNVILAEDSVNTLIGTYHSSRMRRAAAISVENLYIQDSAGVVSYDALATLVIDGAGTLNATGVECTAAIGGNDNRLTGNIIINGGTINATSGNWGAAIGDGDTIDSSNGGQYISKWYCQDFTQNGYSYKKNVNQARIQINGGHVNAVATTATPAIGTSDQLSQASGYQGKEWDGMVIDIQGGTIIAIGGGQYDTAAIGAGNHTKLNPSNIIINQNGNTKILALTQKGGYPIIADAQTTGALPAMSGNSSATVINLKFPTSTPANQVSFKPLVGDTYVEDDTIFPNNILKTLDVTTYGISVVIKPNTYEINAGDAKAEIEVPEGGGMIVGSDKDGELDIKLPPSITTPISVVVVKGANVQAQYSATGTAAAGGSLSFQWQVSVDGGVSWANVPTTGHTTSVNGTTSTLTVDVGDSTEKNGYQYRCMVSETVSASDIRYATSGDAALTVTEETLVSCAIWMYKNNGLWYDSNKEVSIRKDGILYADAIPSYAGSCRFNVQATVGTYEVYVNNENTGLYLQVSQLNTNTVAINYYDVNLQLQGMEGNDLLAIGASSYTQDGTYAIPVLKGKTLSLYARNTNITNSDGTVLRSDIYEAVDDGYNLTDDEKTGMITDKGYTTSAITKQRNISITYKKQYKAKIHIYLNPTSDDIFDGYLWNDSSYLGPYNKNLKLYRTSDNKEINITKVSSGKYQSEEWVFEDDTYNIYVDGADSNVDLSVTSASQSEVLRYYSLIYNGTGGDESQLPEETAYLKGTIVPLTNAVPTMEKYRLEGWSEDFMNIISSGVITMDSKKTLYAMWELAPTAGTGEWKLIDGTDKLKVKFNDEISLDGKIYIYDNPNLTNTYYVTGYQGTYIDLEGQKDYYKHDSKVSIKNYGTTDTSVVLESSETIPEDFSQISVNMGATEFVRLSSQSTFAVTYDTTYFMIKIEGEDDSTGVTSTTYLPIKIEAQLGNVGIRAFQMNTNSAQGAVSEFNPSFRVVSRAGKVMADKTGKLRTVVKYGTIYALDSDVNSDYDGLMKAETLGDNTGVARHYEADDIGTLTNWSGSANDANKEDYFYYALTFKSNSYYLDLLNKEYALTAYAILDNGEVVYDSGDVCKVSIYSIAQALYNNKKMSTESAHNYLYDHVLNIVAISGNEKAIANAVRNALGGGGKGTVAYTYANNLYRDLYYYVQLSGNYNYEKYTMRGKFTSNSMVDDVRNEEKLLAELNKLNSNVTYSSVAQWIYENTDYFYEEKAFSTSNGIVYE